MSVTININNLSLCHKGSNGVSTATIPDVCKTPSPGGPVPIPYPNIALSSDLAKGTTTVKADGGNMCANYGSEFSKSTGDEPGTVGGVASSTFIKEATWITYSFDVKFEGKAACRLTDKMFHNHQNTVNMGGLLQKLLKAGMSLLDACAQVYQRIKDWIGEGVTDKVRGIRGLAERMAQNRIGGSKGVEGAPNFPVDPTKVTGAGGKSFPGGSNSWMRHDAEIEQQQKSLKEDIKDYDDNCNGKGPPVTDKEREWVKKDRPTPQEWQGPAYSAPVATGLSTGAVLTAIGLTVAAGLLGLSPFDGPVGEAVAGAAAARAWGRVFGTAAAAAL